jgi:thymidylate synthase
LSEKYLISVYVLQSFYIISFCMINIEKQNLGELWIAALQSVYHYGTDIGGGTRELIGISVAFNDADIKDSILYRYANIEYIEQMRKVFFSDEPNIFGHNYRSLCKGPMGRSDMSDVIELLRCDPSSKRGVITIIGNGKGKVPCINAVQFLLRDKGIEVVYFSRGQDIFNKFYADGICIYDMAVRVAWGLNRPVATITGMISSAHIYTEDFGKIHTILANNRQIDQSNSMVSEAMI